MRTLPPRRLDSAQEGNRRAAEIERMAVGRQDHLRRVGIENILVRSERLDQRGDLGRRLVETSGDQRQLLLGHERLVALNIDNDVEPLSAKSLRLVERLPTAIRPAAVIGRGHDRAPAETGDGPFDPLVVGSHIAGIEKRSGLLIHMPDHRLASQVGQRLAGETGRGIPGGNQCKEFHSRSFDCAAPQPP